MFLNKNYSRIKKYYKRVFIETFKQTCFYKYVIYVKSTLCTVSIALIVIQRKTDSEIGRRRETEHGACLQGGSKK